MSEQNFMLVVSYFQLSVDGLMWIICSPLRFFDPTLKLYKILFLSKSNSMNHMNSVNHRAIIKFEHTQPSHYNYKSKFTFYIRVFKTTLTIYILKIFISLVTLTKSTIATRSKCYSCNAFNPVGQLEKCGSKSIVLYSANYSVCSINKLSQF